MSERVNNEMINMVHLFAEDRRLRAWFATVEEQPPTARAAAFEQMVHEMRTAGENARLIAAVSALSAPHMFSLVRERVHELRDQDRFALPTLKTVLLLASFLGFAALGIYWIAVSLSHDSYASVDRFWPGLIFVFIAVSILVYALVRGIAGAKRSPNTTRTA
jgi:hypothetical protein